MLISVDFDHTLVDHDKPLPGAKEAMERLREQGHKIMIHSCNDVEWIRKVLNNNDIPFDYIWDPATDRGKPVCAVYIDDRAIGFSGDWAETLREVDAVAQRRRKIPGLL